MYWTQAPSLLSTSLEKNWRLFFRKKGSAVRIHLSVYLAPIMDALKCVRWERLGGKQSLAHYSKRDETNTIQGTVQSGHRKQMACDEKGNEKHDLHVTPKQGSSEPVVQDLAQVVEEVIGVPQSFQKLIFKGKSLKEMETPLSALGIQDGCRVMLIGKKNSPQEEVELKKLKHLEKSVEKIADQLEELNKELTGIQQGFLPKNLQAEALCKLDRRVKATIEQFMKILEEIDTLILPENFKDSRLKRKGLVKKVQAFLAECDTVEQNICQETERLQSTNFALAE
ncbi:BAG family molecular chaperone regulator 1 isoform X2 [Pongo abelii]|uniref:BAG family molecular chaperone regulator 1 isoform X2 n=1 Tax=Pongo abelii TaxID=9601 RepID=UPI003007DEE0